MKINLSSASRPKILLMLVILVLHNQIVRSVDELMKKKFCRATDKDVCIILCQDWNSQSNQGIRELQEILKTEGKRYQSCSLILENCTMVNTTWSELNLEVNPKIENLKILHSSLDINRLDLKIFRNLRKLTLKNTTTDSLRSEVFRRLPKLQQLMIRRDNFVKWVDTGFLQNLSLEILQIQGINLNRTETARFFKNLTAGCEIPKIRQLDWSHNNFGNFTKDLLAPFPNLNLLILTNSSISAFEEDTFATGSIKTVFINRNEIRRLPEKIFSPLLENSSFVSLEGNHFICDCEMKWLQNLVERRKYSAKFRIDCVQPPGARFLDADLCPKNASSTSKEVAHDCNSIQLTPVVEHSPIKFKITKDEPEYIEITIYNRTITDGVWLWYGCYANATSPNFQCLKTRQQIVSISVTPETSYLLCLSVLHPKRFHCIPFKTKPIYENQTWLTNKSMYLSIVSIFVVFLFALAAGALILYLSIRKNPSLLRGSKRVIEVKRHDKAKVLIMPRGYESENQGDPSSLMLLNPQSSLEPSRSTLSCDSISTVSYVSAHQPTQLEILTYRLNRLRELFQRNNNLPPIVPRMQIAVPVNQRLPPDVDLLFEYEWYTITTTTQL